MAEQGITDLEKSGLMYLSNDARARSRPRLPSADTAACGQHLDITANAPPCGALWHAWQQAPCVAVARPPLTALQQLRSTESALWARTALTAGRAARAQMRALHKKAAKAEKVKTEKGGHMMWTEVGELGEMVRRGDMTWEDLALDDIDIRLKWAGLFHRRKRAPGTFMMRLKVRMSILPDVLYLLAFICLQRANLQG